MNMQILNLGIFLLKELLGKAFLCYFFIYRYEAISALLCALKELELRATFTSQINYLVGLLHDEDFENNNFHTGWLDARILDKTQKMPELPIPVTIAVGATVIGYARITEVFSKFQSALEK